MNRLRRPGSFGRPGRPGRVSHAVNADRTIMSETQESLLYAATDPRRKKNAPTRRRRRAGPPRWWHTSGMIALTLLCLWELSKPLQPSPFALPGAAVVCAGALFVMLVLGDYLLRLPQRRQPTNAARPAHLAARKYHGDLKSSDGCRWNAEGGGLRLGKRMAVRRN